VVPGEQHYTRDRHVDGGDEARAHELRLAAHSAAEGDHGAETDGRGAGAAAENLDVDAAVTLVAMGIGGGRAGGDGTERKDEEGEGEAADRNDMALAEHGNLSLIESILG